MKKTIAFGAARRRFQLIFTMAAIVLLVLFSALFELGLASYQDTKTRLLEDVSQSRRLIESVGRFDAQYSGKTHPGGSVGATLSQVLNSQKGASRSGTAELVLAELRDGSIHFILSRRGIESIGRMPPNSPYFLDVPEFSLPMDDGRDLLMGEAVMGKTGVGIGRDYRGTLVVGAYAPVVIGPNTFGIVSKVELYEVVAPYLRAMMLASIIAVVLVGFGSYRFLGLINPLIDNLEEQLRANEALINTSPGAIVGMDAEGRVTSFNRAAERMFGYREDEMVGKNVNLLMPPEVARQHDGYIKRYLETGAGKIVGAGREVEAMRRDGTVFPIHLAVGVMDTPKGRSFVGIIADITARRATEADLRQKQRVVEESPVGVIITDTQGVISYVNPASLRIHGYASPEDLLGKKPNVFKSGHEPADTYRSMWQNLNEGKTWTGELLNKRKDGSLVWVRQHLTQIRDEDGVIRHFVSIQEDVTELRAYRENLEETVRKRTAELEQARDAAESAARAKSMFLANMSHEIRTPMNAIIGFSDVLLRTDLAPAQARHLGIVNRSARSLLALLNDILDLAKLDGGHLRLEAIPFSLPELLEDAVATLNVKAQEKGLALGYRMAEGLPPAFTGDPTRLRQVLINLIGNGIKFTEKGGVTVEVDAGAGEMLHFAVRDTGIGIPKEQHTHIFEAFTQADLSTTRKHGGTGLGTTISKQLVELMKGEIWVESEPGKGSVFHFTVHLPRAAGRHAKETAGAAAGVPDQTRPLRILLADDVPENVELVIERLTEAGHMVHHAPNGAEAVRIFEEEGVFDVVLMDVQMPVMDGKEAARRIRERERSKAHSRTPIIALTSSVMYEERGGYFESGMDALVGKPIVFAELFGTIARLVPARKEK